MKIAGWMSKHPIFVQCALSALLFSPLFVLGENFSHSDRFNHVWVAQFSDQLLHGDLYPRWLGRSFGGLGAPAFYFYPPAFYYVAAIVHVLTGGLLDTSHQIPVAGAIISAGSGVAMYLLLRDQVAGRTAANGALLYQLLPYHVSDFYLRGALGEYTAYVFLPIVLLGMRRIAYRRRGGMVLLPLSYAGLIYSHLPTAMLFSTMLPAYGFFLAWNVGNGKAERLVFVARTGGAALFGIVGGAAYLAPALALLPFMTEQEQWASFHQPARWLIWNFRHWPSPVLNLEMFALATGMAVCAALLLATQRKAAPRNREFLFWAGVTLMSLPLILGLIPGYWSTRPLSLAQFPFRFLAVTDVAFVLACMLYLDRNPFRPLNAQWLVSGLILAAGTAPIGYQIAAQLSALPRIGASAHAYWESDYRDADAYLPLEFYSKRGNATYDQDRDPADLRYSAFAARRLADVYALPEVKGRGTARMIADAPDAMTVDLMMPEPGPVVVRRFFFPSWKVTDASGRAVATAPDPSTGLLTFQASQGRVRYVVRQEWPFVASFSMAISLPTLSLLLAAGVVSVMRRGKSVRRA